MNEQEQGNYFKRVMKDKKKRANPRRLAINGIIRSILRTVKAKRDLPPRVLEALLALDTKTIRETRDLGKLGSLLGRVLMWVITSELPTAASATLALLDAFQKISTIHRSNSSMFNSDDDEPHGPALALQVGTGFALQPQNNGFSDDGDSSEPPRATATQPPAGPATEPSHEAATQPPAGPAMDDSMDAAANLLDLSQQDLTASQVGMLLDGI